MVYVKRRLTYDMLVVSDETSEAIAALGLDPGILAAGTVVVWCVETGQVERLCENVEDFESRFVEA